MGRRGGRKERRSVENGSRVKEREGEGRRGERKERGEKKEEERRQN